MKKIRFLLSWLLVLMLSILCTAPALAQGYGADGWVDYTHVTLEYPVLNRETYSNFTFLNAYVGGNNDSVYNIASRFSKEWYSSGASSMPDSLAPGAVFRHKDNDNTYLMFYKHYVSGTLGPALSKGDLQLCLLAALTNDKHLNLLRHPHQLTAYPTVSVGPFGSPYLLNHSTKDYGYDCTINVGRYDFKQTLGSGLLFRAMANVCTCGSSQVSNVGMMLADVQGPSVTSVYTTRLVGGSMQPWTDFRAGDDLYINLKFNESVRFANNQTYALSNAPKLAVEVKRIVDNVQETGINAEATLVSLSNDTITFKYTVPAEYDLGGKPVLTNYYISGLKNFANGQQSWLGTDKRFDLALPGLDPAAYAAVVHNEQLNKTTSAIVDLAGNPVAIASSKTSLDQPAHMDNVQPAVRRVEVVRIKDANPVLVEAPADSTPRSEVFTGLGDELGFYAYFSEEMLLKAADGSCLRPTNQQVDPVSAEVRYDLQQPFAGVNISLLAELNAAKSGVPLTARAKYMTTLQDGKNGPLVSRVYFALEEAISEEMQPVVYGQPAPLAIDRIYLGDGAGYTWSDARGNLYAEATKLVDAPLAEQRLPQQQLWLDNIKPGSILPGLSGPTYTPVYYAAGNELEFYFPIGTSDQPGLSGDFVSLTNGVEGYFAWQDNTAGNSEAFPFEYAVTGSSAQPAADKFQAGRTGERIGFTQLESGNYLHIRMFDQTEYNLGDSELVVHPTDYAGNEGEVSFPLNYVLDRQGPRIRREDFQTSYAGVDQGSMTVSVSVADFSPIQSVEYQWTAADGTPDAGAWLSVSPGQYAPESTDTRKLLTIVRDSLTSNINHNYLLHIRSRDGAAGANASSASFRLDYNLEYPKYAVQRVTNPEQLLPKHSFKLWLPDRGEVWVPAGNGSFFVRPAENVAQTLLVLVKKPSGGGYGQYWGFSCGYHFSDAVGSDGVIQDFGVRGEAKALDVFSPAADLNGWLSVYAQFGTSEGDQFAYATLGAQDRADLLKSLNGHYGQLQVTVVALPPGPGSYSYLIPNSVPHAVDTYTFNCAAATGGAQVHAIGINPKAAVSYDPSYTKEISLSELPATKQLPSSLDGAVFQVTLSNRLTPAYGLDDIDFASPDTHFALYKTGEGQSDTPLYLTSLIAKPSQEVAIPAGVATANGGYKVVVSIKSKVSGHIDRQEYTNILIDRRALETYGVASVRTKAWLWPSPVLFTDEIASDFALAPGSRPTELQASAAARSTQYIRFSADLPQFVLAGETTHAAYIKVWNETMADVVPLDSYRWVKFSGSREFMVEVSNNYADVIARLQSHVPGLPLIPGDNLIRYQIATTSGRTTPVETLIVHASTEGPLLQMALTPGNTGGTATNGDVLATLQTLESATTSSQQLRLGVCTPAGFSQELSDDLRVDQQVTLSQNGDYYFYAFDRHHNVGWQKVTVDYIDKLAPELTVVDKTEASGNAFKLTATLHDGDNSGSCRLFIGFDHAYAELLGIPQAAPEPGQPAQVTLLEVPVAQSWLATQANQSGIYDLQVNTDASGAKVVDLFGAFRHDPQDAATSIDRTVTLFAVDGAGNRSHEWSKTFSAQNQRTAYLSGSLSGGGFVATFNKPVLLQNPSEGLLMPSYALVKSNLPFYQNGSYPVTGSDIFGDSFSDQIAVNQFDELYNCTVKVSQLEPTNQDVQVVINAAFNPQVRVQLPAAAGMTVMPELNGQGEVIGGTITLAQNGNFSFSLVPVDTGFAPMARTVVVGNIDKTAPQAQIVWSYAGSVVNGKTGGMVTASLLANEELLPLAGSGTSHLFTLADQEPYVFHYSDRAGNSGSLTATLPVTIVEQASLDLDSTPPDYELAIYQSRNGVSGKVGSYTRSEYESLGDKSAAYPLFSGQMQLRFQVFDQNQTTLSIAENVGGYTVPGVSLSGTTVTVSENAAFTVLITDAKGNQTAVTVQINSADNSKPTGTVTYVKTGRYAIRGYLTMTDDHPVTLQNTSGVLVETVAGQHFGQYYHDFLDNESFTFIFADAAGNVGTTVAAVTSLDMNEPTGSIVQWVPYFVDHDGVIHSGQLSDLPTNADVSVYLQFSKPIQTITPSIRDGVGDLQDISLAHEAESATVVFRQNAQLRLEFVALNGRSNVLLLDVGIIDKAAPSVAVSGPVGDAKAVKYSFVPDEYVYVGDSGVGLAKDAVYEQTYELNGQYAVKFTDRAGNVTRKTVTVSGIDREAPGLTITDLPATKEAVAKYNADHGTNIAHLTSTEPVVVKASMDEIGVISFNGVSHPVAAGQAVALTINANGSYEVAATDAVGLITRCSFRVDCIDRIAPFIQLPGNVLSVRQGTALAEFQAKALEQATVSDNHDSGLVATLSSALTATELNTVGSYSITYLAQDGAGNSTTATRAVRVYPQNALEVLLNGTFVQAGETLFVDGGGSRAVSVAVGNLPTGSNGSEPYQMFWKAGLCTPGQMKNANLFAGSFTPSKDGFYTVYIATQSRGSFIAYLYLQQ